MDALAALCLDRRCPPSFARGSFTKALFGGSSVVPGSTMAPADDRVAAAGRGPRSLRFLSPRSR